MEMKEMNYTKEQLYEYGMRDIPGYEGLYAITSCGRVWSYKRKIFLKPNKNNCGYLYIVLSKNGNPKTKTVHRLVMETYCPIERMKDLQVNHKTEIKIDNSLNNLEWCDARYNNNYGTRNQRTRKRVLCVETDVIYESISDAARQTKIDISSISKCCRGKQKTAGGFHWQYID